MNEIRPVIQALAMSTSIDPFILPYIHTYIHIYVYIQKDRWRWEEPHVPLFSFCSGVTFLDGSVCK
jgi:hypothetical protein